MELNSNFKGNVTELQCVLSFTKSGYQVSLPFGGQARYDFIADVNGKLIRVQVKTAKIVSEDVFRIECRNSHYLQGHHTHTRYRENEIDYFATYFQNKCYLIPADCCGSAKTFRLTLPSNNITTVNYAEQYELKKVLNSVTQFE